MNLYIDTSVFVKLLIEEEDSDAAREIWGGAGRLATSRLTYPETRAALARAERAGRLNADARRHAVGMFEAEWGSLDVVVDIRDPVARLAGGAAEAFGLRTGDAIHLATAISMAGPELVVATWDRALALAASRAGLGVAPPLE